MNYESKISERAFQNFIKKLDTDAELDLNGITTLPSGYGHYKISYHFDINGNEKIIEKVTDNMPLIDAWKSGEGNFEEGVYDNWKEVEEAILDLIVPAYGDTFVDEFLYETEEE